MCKQSYYPVTVKTSCADFTCVVVYVCMHKEFPYYILNTLFSVTSNYFIDCMAS